MLRTIGFSITLMPLCITAARVRLLPVYAPANPPSSVRLLYLHSLMVVPFFGDQFFWAKRIKDLGVGDWVHAHGGLFKVSDMTEKLGDIARDFRMHKLARELSRKIKSEDGITEAENVVYAEFTRSLTRNRWDEEYAVRIKESEPGWIRRTFTSFKNKLKLFWAQLRGRRVGDAVEPSA